MINYFTAPFRWFFKLEAASGLLLLIGAVIALILSNSNLSEYYFNILNTHILIGVQKYSIRGVAQSGSASGLGPEGRRFKSCRPDH